LLDALTRQPEKLGRIAKAQIEVFDEHPRSSCRRRSSLLLSGLRVFTGIDSAPKNALHPAREADVVDKLDALRVLDPEAERLTGSPSRLLDRSPVRMASGNAGDGRDPRAALVAFVDDAIPLHPSQSFPRHGSRSRSIARSVPGGRSSPAWIGTVVLQRPHLT
jgi:hypothetical protein